MKRLLMILAAGAVLLLSMSALPATASAASAAANAVEGGADATNSDGPTVDNAIAVGLNILSMLVGLASVVMIVLGAYKFVTSAGDASKVASARSTIIYACIGIAVVALAQIIVRFVIAKVTDQSSGGGGGGSPGGGFHPSVMLPSLRSLLR